MLQFCLINNMKFGNSLFPSWTKSRQLTRLIMFNLILHMTYKCGEIPQAEFTKRTRPVVRAEWKIKDKDCKCPVAFGVGCINILFRSSFFFPISSLLSNGKFVVGMGTRPYVTRQWCFSTSESSWSGSERKTIRRLLFIHHCMNDLIAYFRFCFDIRKMWRAADTSGSPLHCGGHLCSVVSRQQLLAVVFVDNISGEQNFYLIGELSQYLSAPRRMCYDTRHCSLSRICTRRRFVSVTFCKCHYDVLLHFLSIPLLRTVQFMREQITQEELLHRCAVCDSWGHSCCVCCLCSLFTSVRENFIQAIIKRSSEIGCVSI